MGGIGFSASVVPFAWQINPKIWLGAGFYLHSIPGGKMTPRTYPEPPIPSERLEWRDGRFRFIPVPAEELKNVTYRHGDVSGINSVGLLLGARYSFSETRIFNNVVPFVAATGSVPVGKNFSGSFFAGQFRSGFTFYGLPKNAGLSVFAGLTMISGKYYFSTIVADYERLYEGSWTKKRSFFEKTIYGDGSYLYFNFGISVEF